LLKTNKNIMKLPKLAVLHILFFLCAALLLLAFVVARGKVNLDYDIKMFNPILMGVDSAFSLNF
jgi:hypothetical protein